MAGDIVLQNGTQQNIWERPFGRLILIASCFSVISAIAVAFIYERLRTKSLKSNS